MNDWKQWWNLGHAWACRESATPWLWLRAAGIDRGGTPLPRSQADVTVRLWPWLQTASRSHESTSHIFNFGSSDVVQNIDRTSPGTFLLTPDAAFVTNVARFRRQWTRRLALIVKSASREVACQAQILASPWPMKPRGVGRPSDIFLWQEQHYKAIDRDHLLEGLTAQPPPWWKPAWCRNRW